MTEQWRFPPSLSAAIRWHHTPTAAVIGAPAAFAVAAGIKLLDRLAVSPEAPPVGMEDPVFVRLGLSEADQTETRREVWTELERLQLVAERRRSDVSVRKERRAERKKADPAR